MFYAAVFPLITEWVLCYKTITQNLYNLMNDDGVVLINMTFVVTQFHRCDRFAS